MVSDQWNLHFVFLYDSEIKESFAKAYGTGIGAKLGFHDIEIIDNQYGAPIVTKSPYNGNAHASVSHTATLVMTEVILESENK